ncbi:gem-associated protein 6-like [Prorops nasuta]|uniref:gem-associated protein 6-like n=1 Tax=Prorops nasuta TaxID=863751 RepID=UPI0034CDADB6
MAQTESSDFSHRIYKNDPILFKSYVNKKVDISTDDSQIHTGIVYTVDPVSESIVLIQCEGLEKERLRVILGHTIKNIKVFTEEQIIPELFSSALENIPRSVLIERKNKLKTILINNRFPVTERNDTLYIQDIVSIEPPYKFENCICTNSIVLNRIQKILSNI